MGIGVWLRFLLRFSNRGHAPKDAKALSLRAFETVKPFGGDVGNLRISSYAIELDLLLDSKSTLQKAVQALRKLGYVGSTAGRFGGLSLAVPASSIRIGSVVAALESMGHLVNCNKGPCPLDGACLLKLALDRAERGFFLELDQYSLADVVRGPTADVLDMLLSA